MLKKTTYILGVVLVIAVLIAASIVATYSYINPYPTSKFPIDPGWAIFFAGCLTLWAVLWIPGSGVKLKWVPIVILAGLVSFIFILSPARISLLGLIFFGILFISVGYPVNQLILPALKPAMKLDQFILAWGTGFGVVALLVFFLGMSGGLKLTILWGGVILLSVVFIPAFLIKAWKNYRDWKSKNPEVQWPDQRGAILVGGCLVLGIGSLFWALTPSIRYDALVYQLAAPEAYLQYGKIIPQLMNFQTVQAHASHMVYTLALGTFGQPLPSLLHLTAGLLAVAMTYLTAQKLGGRRVGYLAAILFGSLPLVDFEAGAAYNDLFVALYSICSVYALLEWEEKSEKGWLLLAGLMAGFAMGVKVNIITLLIPVGIFLVIRLIQKHGFSWQSVTGAVLFGIPILLLYAPWAVRDWIWTRNPVFPLLGNIFPSPVDPVWSMVQDLFHDYPQNIALRIVRLPWDLTFNTAWYYHEGLNGALGAVPLLALPWVYLTPSSLKKEERIRRSILLTITMIAMVLYILESVRVRTMMHLFPLLSILAALNVETIWQSIQGYQNKKLLVGIIGLLGFFYLFSTRLNLIVRGWEILERFPYRAALGLQSPQDFLSQNLRVYEPFRYLDRQTGEHKVFSIGIKFNLYTRSEIWGDPISGGDALIGYDKNEQPAELARRLEDHSFDYLLVDWEAVKASQLEGLPILSPGFLKEFAHLVFNWKDISIYTLSPVAVDQSTVKPNNLLQDASFETLPQPGGAIEWAITSEQAGEIWTAKSSHSGKYAVTPEPDIAMFQEVPVVPGELYSLSHWTRADIPNQLARLQINWMDETHTYLSTSFQVVEVGTEWTQSEFSVSPPANAAYAEIFVSTHENSQVFFDDYCFAEGDECVP